MMDIETNIFPISNLDDLSFRYDTYRVRNLRREHPEYFQNKDALVHMLSYRLRAPVQIIERNGEPLLVIPNSAIGVPEKVTLVRSAVHLDKVDSDSQLDFGSRTMENDAICLRLVQFIIQEPMRRNNALWQPSAGSPFFEKQPTDEERGTGRYCGFGARAVVTPSGGIGLCVDVRNKYVSTKPIPTHLDRLAFRDYEGQRCVYRYGHRWYEVRVEALSDLSVSEEEVTTGGRTVSLLDYMMEDCSRPLPREFAALPEDAAVLKYRNNRGEERGAAAGLCYPVRDTRHDVSRNLHRGAILRPDVRRRLIGRYVRRYLTKLRFNNVGLRVCEEPDRISQQVFSVPDVEFGNGCKLSVVGSDDAHKISLDSLGRRRLDLLRRKEAGFYVKQPFRRQYLVLPQSVADSWGMQFARDLTCVVNELYPEGGGYDPDIVTYNDRRPRTYRDQGKAIVESLNGHFLESAYAMVMVHSTTDRHLREHDVLAAMVIRELRKRDIFAAVNHSAMGERCYVMVPDKRGTPHYETRRQQRGRFSGYLRNVALNKILLTNEFWPFVLASPTHADVTIGIDVKNQTAGFTIIGKRGSFVRTVCQESRQREKLLKPQVMTHLMELLRAEGRRYGNPLKAVVIHRDGRCWQSEIDGATEAIARLKNEGVVAHDGALSILEISKTAPVRLRLFEVHRTNTKSPYVANPQVGTYVLINRLEGFVCTTGRAFPRQGTVQPLHVRCVLDGLPLEQALEDVYALSNLAWTRPEDCSRYPITLRLTDRRLGEDASEFDQEALRYIGEADEVSGRETA